MTPLKRTILLLAFGLSLSLFQVNAQHVSSRKYNMDNALSSNRVYSVLQDSCGFMWFGTDNGLNRFDGITFKTYYFSDEKGSISNNNIRKLYIDKQNLMWVALDSGVDIYNPQTGMFSHFETQTLEGEKVTACILDILEDQDGEIWMATNGTGLYRYSPQTDSLQVYRHKMGDDNSLAQDYLMTLLQDSRGTIWIGTYSGGVCCFDKEKEQFTTYKKGQKGLSDNSIHKIQEDSFGNIWVGTFQNGLDLFDTSTGTFINYKDKSEKNLLYHIHDIIEYTPGELLIAADNGIGIFRISEGRILSQDEATLKIPPFSNKFIYSIFKDKEESIWLGSYFDGLEFFSAFRNNFEYHSCIEKNNQQNGKVINSIREDGKGNYWIGTDDNGIFRFDQKTRQVIPFRKAADIGSTYYCVHDLLLDNGQLFAATYERGLEVFNLATGQIKSYLHNPADSTSIPSSRVFVLYKSGNGRIYIGTANGLCYYNRETDNFKRIVPPHRISAITEDGQGKIWVATAQNGLFVYDIKKETLTNYEYDENDKNSLSRNTLTSLAVDRKKRLWIGTYGYGLCRYEPLTDNFVRYTHLDLPNQIISSIVPDGDYLWLSTNKGLVHYNPDSGEQKTYSRSNGLYNEQFTLGSAIRTTDGQLFLGTTDGFCFFSPQQLVENLYEAPLVLTRMTLFGEEIKPAGDNSPLTQAIEFTNEVILNHKQSMIGFDFASLSFVAPEENLYHYKLEGIDHQWHSTRGGHNHISYTNLSPGTYTLRVKGTNSDKKWSTAEIQFKINILPPFFKSKVAYIHYAVLLILLIALVIYYIIKRSEKKHQRRIKKLESEKEKELYDSKIEFFTHIAHEIRTPLSLIVGPLEYLMKTVAIDNIYGDYLAIIEQNYKRLFTLVNQLLDFRKVDSGLYSLTYSVCNLKSHIESVTSLFYLTTQQKNIQIKLSVNPENLQIVTDEEALTKILSNLLTNAIKYAESHISVLAYEKEQELFIEVTDDGPGISHEDKNKIFNAFYQSKGNNEIARLGIGIGLHMTRSLTLLLGGNISVHDRQDGEKGTTFILKFPKKQKDLIRSEKGKEIEEVFILNQHDRVEEGSEIEAQTVPPVRHYSIMAVDDNPEILDFLSRILGKEYFVISASSGEEALKFLSNNQVDLIVSDVMMDQMDGLELCRLIKTDFNTSHIPVILLTAKTGTESKIEGLQAGADAYIEKPFSPFHLIAQIQNLLKKRIELQEKYATNPFEEIKGTVHTNLDEEFMNKCTAIIEQNLSDSDFSVTILAKELAMSRTSIFTKIKGITGMTPNDFIKLTRLKAACKMMAQGDYRITEIGFLVGFSSSSYFAKCFQKQFGILPTEFITRLRQEKSE